MKKITKNTKKKGFTLIELIAVIAILAILGAVLVPKIAGYQNKANKSNVQTGAKTMVHAIQAYNADASTPAVDTDNVGTVIGLVNQATGGPNTTIDTTSTDPKNAYVLLNGLTVADLCGIADATGNFTYVGNPPGVTVTTQGTIN